MMKTNREKMLKILLYFCIIYYCFVLFLYEFGPWAWESKEVELFYFLHFCYIVFFCRGYISGLDNERKNIRIWGEDDDEKLLSILKMLLLPAVFMYAISIMRNYGLNGLDITELFEKMFIGFNDLGEGYKQHADAVKGVDSSNLVGGSIYQMLSFIWLFAGFNIILLTVWYFKKIHGVYKLLGIVLLLESFMFFISIGTNIGVFRLLLAFIIFYFLKKINTLWRLNKFFSLIDAVRIVALVTILGVGGIYFFVLAINSRVGGLDYTVFRQFLYGGGTIELNPDSIFFMILPEFLYIPLILVSDYLTQGYYGFNLCLQIPWDFTYGVGYFKAFHEYCADIFNLDIESLTYQYRIFQEFGWHNTIKWSSTHTWFANDISFWGVIPLMYFFGYYLAKAYYDFLNNNNVFAGLLLYYLIFTFIFISANSQITDIVIYPSFLLVIVFWNRSKRVLKWWILFRWNHIDRK